MRSRRGLLIVFVVIGVLLASAIVAAVIAASAGSPRPDAAAPPHPGMSLLVAAETDAAAAAATARAGSDARAAAAYLAEMPTAVWLTPEESDVEEVGATVTALLAEAADQEAALVLVVYGLPERDCGRYSAGGLDPAEYEEWTTEIGRALRKGPDLTTIVVLEPDSLALATECGDVDDRVDQLRSAIDDLTDADTWIYLDGGHSNWLPADEMADLLTRAGVDRVRGFATNVSNYNTLREEEAYARTLARKLGGAHAVIDTSRSGAGSDGQWCNPPGRLVGEAGATDGDDVVDVNLWIKPPGESDGTCNGGPDAGEWWSRAAVELARYSTR